MLRVEELKLLSKLEKAGLLSSLEKRGLTLSYIENSGLLSKAEKFGVLSAAADRCQPDALRPAIELAFQSLHLYLAVVSASRSSLSAVWLCSSTCTALSSAMKLIILQLL